jgi:hypothetical protein
MTRVALMAMSVLGIAGCGPTESGRTQRLEFPAFTVEEGIYRPKSGWTFTAGEKGTVVAARQVGGPGIVITPCECALETGGSCAQASIENPDGSIRELWCVDQDCGFCVGGTVEPDDPESAVRFNVVCIADRAVRSE